MRNHIHLTALAISALVISGTALAQQQSGSTSGPAAGKPVEPPTVVEKKYEGRSGMNPETGNPAAGMPGVEAKPGTEGGKVSPNSPDLKR